MQEIKERKIMYHMIMALEHDLIDYLCPYLSVQDFTADMICKINSRTSKAFSVKEMLEQLSFGDFLELINLYKVKLGITQNDLSFLNKNCYTNIVEIRNRVMHPKPLLFNDYAVLSNLFYKIDSYVHSIAWLNVLNARDEIDNNLQQIL